MFRKKETLLFGACIIAVVLIPPLLKYEALFGFFNFSGRDLDKVADAVNGFTAPVIGLVSAFLLYRALTLQQSQNDSNLILGMITAIRNDISNFKMDGQTKTWEGEELLTLSNTIGVTVQLDQHKNHPFAIKFSDIIFKIQIAENVLDSTSMDKRSCDYYRHEIQITKKMIAKPLRSFYYGSSKFARDNDPVFLTIQRFYLENEQLLRSVK